MHAALRPGAEPRVRVLSLACHFLSSNKHPDVGIFEGTLFQVAIERKPKGKKEAQHVGTRSHVFMPVVVWI